MIPFLRPLILFLALSALVSKAAPNSVTPPHLGIPPKVLADVLSGAPRYPVVSTNLIETSKIFAEAPFEFFAALGIVVPTVGVQYAEEVLGPANLQTLRFVVFRGEFDSKQIDLLLSLLSASLIAADVVKFPLKKYLLAKPSQTASKAYYLAKSLRDSAGHLKSRAARKLGPPEIRQSIRRLTRANGITVRDLFHHSKAALNLFVGMNIANDRVDAQFATKVVQRWAGCQSPLATESREKSELQRKWRIALDAINSGPDSEEHAQAIAYSTVEYLYAGLPQLATRSKQGECYAMIQPALDEDEVNGSELRSFLTASLLLMCYPTGTVEADEIKSKFFRNLNGEIGSLLDAYVRGHTAEPGSGHLGPFIEQQLPLSRLRADAPYRLRYNGCHALFGQETSVSLTAEVIDALTAVEAQRGTQALNWLIQIYNGAFKYGRDGNWYAHLDHSPWRLQMKWLGNGSWTATQFVTPEGALGVQSKVEIEP